jgi:hypothetical protein
MPSIESLPRLMIRSSTALTTEPSRWGSGSAWLAAATLAEPVADAVHLTAEAKLAQLAPEPGIATTPFIEALIEIGCVVIDTRLPNTRRRLSIDFSLPELLHGPVIKVELPAEFPIRSSCLQELSYLPPSLVPPLPVRLLDLEFTLTPWWK